MKQLISSTDDLKYNLFLKRLSETAVSIGMTRNLVEILNSDKRSTCEICLVLTAMKSNNSW